MFGSLTPEVARQRIFLAFIKPLVAAGLEDFGDADADGRLGAGRQHLVVATWRDLGAQDGREMCAVPAAEDIVGCGEAEAWQLQERLDRVVSTTRPGSGRPSRDLQ